MDPPPPSSTAPATTTTTTNKLRLMCSYGGRIISRPNNTKSLYYAGGDTRIITIPTTTTTATLTLSSLITHLSSALHVNYPFTLKYQLPSHDLDSLISISNDDDLLIMLDENHRLSPTPSRIRLFLFSTKSSSGEGELIQFNELKHPKTETWFADVLKSAKIMQKGCGGGGGGVGFGLEGNCEGNSNEINGLCGAESLILETSSSFGSTSSSVSSSNLPAKGAQVEDFGAAFLDNKVKLPASESFSTSDNSIGVSTTVSQLQTGAYREPVAPVASMEDTTCCSVESDSKIVDSSIAVEMPNTVHVSRFPLSLQFDQPQVQFVHPATPHYLPHNSAGVMPVPSYYVMSSPVPPQQTYYQTNQPSPIYFVPVGHPYNMPMQSNLISPATIASNRPPAHPNSSANPAHLAYKVAIASPVPEVGSQVYRTVPMTTPLVNAPHNENHHQAGGLPQVNQQAQSVGITSLEPSNYTNELDEDPLRIQIYKSQPPPPKLPTQYSTMTKATTVMLSEALAKLKTETAKQQIRTSHPQ